MSSISPKPNTSRYGMRSISLPSRSHPNILGIESELKRLKTLEASSMPLDHTETLSRLGVVYKFVENMLNLSMTQQALSHYKNEKWVDWLLDVSITVLDICDILKEMVSQMKECVRDLQCALRRRKGDSSIESSIVRFTSFRKKIKKDAKKLVSNLKQVNNVVGGASMVADLDHHHLAVIRVLMEVSETTIFTFGTLFSFFSVKPKPSRWTHVSKMMHRGRVSCEVVQGKVNNLENLETALLNLCRNGSSDGQKCQIENGLDCLEEMEAYMENIENGLDCLFRNLIKTRSLLLNIRSQ